MAQSNSINVVIMHSVGLYFLFLFLFLSKFTKILPTDDHGQRFRMEDGIGFKLSTSARFWVRVYRNPMNNSTSIPLCIFLFVYIHHGVSVNDRRQQLALITFALWSFWKQRWGHICNWHIWYYEYAYYSYLLINQQ